MKRFLPRFIAILFLGGIAACSGPDLNDPAVQAALTESKNLGLAYLEENQLLEAEAAFLEVLELNPDDASGQANLGIVYLRSGSYEKAEGHLLKAVELAPDDPNIPLSLATLYEQTERTDLARSTISTALEQNPDHVQTLYKRAQLYSTDNDPSLAETYAGHLRTVVQYAPANIVPRFYLVESLTQAADLQNAFQELNDLRQQLPDIPREAQPHYEAAIAALQAEDTSAAFRSVRVFHNVMKVTPYYQTSLRLLGLRTDAAVGVPVISEPTGLGQAAFTQGDGSPDILDGMEFTDASANAGLQNVFDFAQEITSMVLLDIDGDKETDVFATAWNPSTNTASYALLRNQFGRFTNITDESGIEPVSAKPLYALAADYDNDTFLDLFVFTEGQDLLYHNQGDGTFKETGAETGIDVSDVQKALFADIDHDGDLDLLVAQRGPLLAYQNNLDGSFSEITEKTGFSEQGVTDIDFGDFDDDGDLDLLFTGNAGLKLYSNARQGVFELLKNRLPQSDNPAPTSAVGDYNNDGFLDIFSMSDAGPGLYTSEGENQFQYQLLPLQGTNSAEQVLLVDIDNDGFLDLFLSGETPHLFHNNREGSFEDVTARMLPSALPPSHAVSFTDYNLDRDLDLFLQADNEVVLLRNDGGQANRLLSIQTRGLVNNNSKNNYYSIGAKVELRAGDLYQTRVVTDPVTYFGLGKRVKADVIRIVFTNGVPQNIFRPGTDQDIIEQQILKGSCPFLYTWNGERYVFATDLLWRSALGMPLGIMAEGNTAYAPASPAEDYIMIPNGLLVPDNDTYKIKITDELWETPFIDEVKLIVVDAPDTVEIRIDEKFGPPPAALPPVHNILATTPVQATQSTGEDVSWLLKEVDQKFVYPNHTTRFQGLTAPYSITLTPEQQLDPERAVLYMKGWIFPTDASINMAMSQSDTYSTQPPAVQVKDRAGAWQTVIPNMGFPMGKNKTVRIDLSGKFLSDDQHVRILTNMQLYWDHAFFAIESDVPAHRTTRLSPVSADLQYRGFSRMYRTSPLGPHLFDHDDVSTAPRWQDLAGLYTRYGDVEDLLLETNDQYVIMNAGDAMTIAFDAGKAPPLPDGWTRRFILYTNGWLKDGDLNTAYGQTVNPLPFMGMSAYPYDTDESYPLTPSNQKYLETYNTRVVSPQPFRDWLKNLETE